MYYPVVLFFFLITLPLRAEIVWQKDYETAKKISEKEQKPLLLFFSGDTVGWSQKLHQELFANPKFLQKTEEQFVFFEVDGAHPSSLKEALHVAELPRIILLNSKGKEISRLGYFDEKGEHFAEKLLEPLRKNRELNCALEKLSSLGNYPRELEKLYEWALELKREEDADYILARGMESREPLFFLIEKYRLLAVDGKVEEKEKLSVTIHALDPNNAKESLLSLALIDFQTLASQEALPAKKVIEPLEDYIEKYGSQDAKNRWRIEMMIAQFYLNYDEWKVSLAHAEKAFESAPQEVKKEIEPCLSYLKAHYEPVAHRID